MFAPSCCIGVCWIRKLFDDCWLLSVIVGYIDSHVSVLSRCSWTKRRSQSRGSKKVRGNAHTDSSFACLLSVLLSILCTFIARVLSLDLLSLIARVSLISSLCLVSLSRLISLCLSLVSFVSLDLSLRLLLTFVSESEVVVAVTKRTVGAPTNQRNLFEIEPFFFRRS